MRAVSFVVWACLCPACDSVWDLEHVSVPEVPEVPADAACITAGHDEDLDSLDDGCDPCPFDANNDGDMDGDGIANACDPDPLVANQRLLFTGFDLDNRAGLMIFDGNYGTDEFRSSPTDVSGLLWMHDPDDIWVTAGISVMPPTSAQYFHEVGLMFDATIPEGTLNGTTCVLGRDGMDVDYVEVYARNRPNADKPINSTDMPAVRFNDFHGVIRASYDRDEIPAVSCAFATDTGTEATITGTQAPPPPPGNLALFTLDANVVFRFLFVVTKP